MKALFAHDHQFFVEDNPDVVYSLGKLPYEVMQRYLEHFESVCVVARLRPLGQAVSSKLTVSSGPGLTFFFVPNISTPKGMLVNGRTARRTIRDLVAQCDVVIARVPSEVGWIAAHAAKAAGKPCIVEVVACAWDALWNYGNLAGKLWAPIAFMRTRNVVRNAQAAIYVTEEFLQRRYPSRAHVVAGCSDVQIPVMECAVLERRLARIRDRTGSQERRLGLIGGLSTAAKGFDVAFQSLVRLPAGVTLDIVGGGPQEGWLAKARELGVADRVRFMGALPAGEPVFNWLDGLDAYVQPSFQEGLPRALVEAMSRGLPCWASTAGGIPELLDNAVLHRPGDYRKFATDMGKGIWDTDSCLALAQRNFNTATSYSQTCLDQKRRDFWKRAIALANGQLRSDRE